MTDVLSTATKWKDDGNQQFKAGQYDKDLENYSNGINSLTSHLKETTENSQLKSALEVLLTNRAAVYLKTENFSLAYNDCNEVLIKYNKLNNKALYRSAQAIFNGKLTISQTASVMSTT